MADGNTVDSLQIEIEASSAEAEKKVDALAAALERLKKATTGFGNIGDRIKQIGNDASDTPAAAKTKQQREALDRAVNAAKPSQVTGVDASKAGEQIESINGKIEKAKAAIAELNEQIRMLGFAHDKEQGAQAIAQLNEELSRQQGILDSLIEKREKLAAVIAGAATEQPKQTGDPWADVKAQLKGSTLGDLVGDTGSVDEAVSRMVDLNDQTALLNVKLDGLQEKLRGAFKKGNQSQVASYTAQIQKLRDQLAELKNAPAQAQDFEVEMVESEDSLQKKLGILQRISETVQKMSGTKIDIGSASGLKELLGKDLSLQSLIPKGAASGLKALEGAFGGLKDKMIGVAAAHPVLAAALIGVSIAAKTVGKAVQSLAQTATSAAKKGFGLLAAGAKKLTSALKNLVTTGAGKAVSGLKSVGKSVVSSFTRPFTDALGAYNKWKNAIGRIAFYRAVREAIKAVTDGFKTGMDNLYQYSRLVGTEFAPAMNSLATSALYLKNSLGAMAAPLVQALAPAIDFLIDKFVTLINVIGKAFAMLTGKSVYTQAKKHAVEYGEAANKASKATKDFLLGIDELNVLNDTASGAGGAAEDFGSMFEEVEIDQDQFDWVKQIREAIENGEWRSLGELVADKLNEIVDGWDSYAWGAKLGGLLNNGLNVAYGFLTTFDFAKFGSKVADGLNGLFDEVDWDLLGRTFAAKWNALFDFIYGFATTLKWHEIGLDISQAINGFLDELDPSKAAQAVSSFATGLFDMLNTAIAETNWNVLGDKLGQFISEVDWQGAIYGALSIITNGLAALKEGIDGFLLSWNWQGTAQQTYTAVNQAFSDVDWGGLGTTLSNAFTTAFNFLRETIAGIEWESIGSDVAAFLNEIDWAGLLSSVATTIAEAFNSVVDALGALVRDLKWDEVGRAVGNAINDFFATFDFKSFFTGLVNLVIGIATGISEALTTINWGQTFRAMIDGIKAIDWAGLLGSVATLIVDTLVLGIVLAIESATAIIEIGADIVLGLLKGIKDGLLNLPTWLKEHLVDPIVNGVKGLFGIHSPSTVFAEIGGLLIEGLLQGVSQAWNTIVDFFKTGIETLKTNFAQGWESIKTAASTAWETIRTNLSTTWENIKTSAGEKFTAIKESVSTAWENTKTATSEKWESIKSTLGTTWENLKASAGTTFENIKATVGEKWESIKTDTGEKWENVKSTLSDAWDSMKSTATSKLADIKGSISDTWGNIVSSAVIWGRDLCSNLADGIRSGIGRVKNAVSDVAERVRDFLHFTEPDVGPLSDFHTYMPDMLGLMAKGIKENSYLAVNAASDLADRMSRTLGNIEPVEPKFSNLPNYEMSFSTSNIQGRESFPNHPVSSDSSTGGNDNSDLINAFYSAAGMIVEAIQNQENGVYLDGKQLMQSVEKSQRQRGADIMGGGVLY